MINLSHHFTIFSILNEKYPSSGVLHKICPHPSTKKKGKISVKEMKLKLAVINTKVSIQNDFLSRTRLPKRSVLSMRLTKQQTIFLNSMFTFHFIYSLLKNPAKQNSN